MGTIDKFILIDNGNASKHKDMFSIFEEVFFYERFKKSRIIEYNQGVRTSDAKLLENVDV